MSKKDLNAFDASEANEDELNAVTGGAGKVSGKAHVAAGDDDEVVKKTYAAHGDYSASNTKPAFKDFPAFGKQQAAEKTGYTTNIKKQSTQRY